MKQLYLSLFFVASLISTLQAANDKYRLTITDDPATTMTIGWNQISGHSVALFYGTVDHGTDYQSYENFQLPDRTVAYKGMNNYFVRLKNLMPNTAYYFVIVDSEGVSERFWFETLPDDPTVPLSIIAGGDSRRSGWETTPHEPRIQSNQVVKAIRPHFVAFGGDYTDANTAGQWQTWLDDWQYTIGDDGRMTPIYNTRGNHEHSNEDITALFDVTYDDVYYAINFGGSLIRFYTLNSMVSVAGDQTNWLAQDLEENKAATAWKLAQYHYTIAPHTASKPYRFAQYTHWAPLFHQYGLQLIIECDTHVARNSWPVRPSGESGSDGGFIRDDETGTVYAGEGSWGLIRDANVNYNWTREAGSFTQVKWIHANLDSLVVYTIKSATSNPSEPVADEDRFVMPEGMDLWETDNGDRVVIDRPNPLYELTTSTRSTASRQATVFVQRLFPNPSNSILNIELREAEQHQYQVFDLSGRLVTQGAMRGANHTLDITDYANGVYYLKVWQRNAQQAQVKKFIKN